ncbi:phage major capsid protein [Roseovarius aestuarii]|nr:phage major capsid protein [Roseovarius aestuarii]
MKKLAELKKQRDALKANALKLLNLADSEARDLSAEEEASYEAFESQITDINAEIDQAEKLAERRRTMDALSPALSNVVHDTDPAKTGGFKGLGEFAHAVMNASRSGGVVDRRLMAEPANVHQGGASTGEGFEVPAEFKEGIFEVVEEMDEFGPMVDEEPTSKRKVEALADESTPWGSGGVEARWRSEGTKMEASKLATDPRTVVLHECYAFVLATEELLEDAPRLESRITKKAGQAIAWKKNAAMVYGTGAGQPLGWMKSDALITIAKEGSQAADTIQTENVLAMYSRLLRVPGDKPRWLANSDTLPQLMTMKVGDTPIWMPPNGMVDAPGGMLLGLPIDLTEHAKSLGDKGDLQLISPKGYYALKREDGPKFAQSMHLYFDYAIEAFRWTFRFGGQPHLSAPVSPAHGSSTKSHFVALAERS